MALFKQSCRLRLLYSIITQQYWKDIYHLSLLKWQTHFYNIINTRFSNQILNIYLSSLIYQILLANRSAYLFFSVFIYFTKNKVQFILSFSKIFQIMEYNIRQICKTIKFEEMLPFLDNFAQIIRKYFLDSKMSIVLMKIDNHKFIYYFLNYSFIMLFIF